MTWGGIPLRRGIKKCQHGCYSTSHEVSPFHIVLSKREPWEGALQETKEHNMFEHTEKILIACSSDLEEYIIIVLST